MKTHTAKPMPKPRKRGKNAVNDTVVIQVTLTTQLMGAVDVLLKTGFFGNSRASACDRLISESIRARLKEGVIQAAEKARGE